MKQKIQVELVYKTNNQRFYKFSKKLKVGSSGFIKSYSVDISKEMSLFKETLKEDYRKCIGEDHYLVCVSDAHTHAERIVFMAMELGVKEYPFARTQVKVGGEHTMKIHGGDISSMRDDYVYLRLLARQNGYSLNTYKEL